MFRYESIIATLCENLDSLDEPDARAAMIWIVGEYAERIDNADELLESFLEGFHDESTQVGYPVALFAVLVSPPPVRIRNDFMETSSEIILKHLCTGSAHSVDCHRQAVPEEAIRDSGVGAAGPQPGHTGEVHLPSEEARWFINSLLDDLLCFRVEHFLVISSCSHSSNGKEIEFTAHVLDRFLCRTPTTLTCVTGDTFIGACCPLTP